MSGNVRFGSFEFDPERRELRKLGLRIRVPDQSLKILAALVQHPGEVVTRERIQDELWPDGTIVEFEQSIKSAVWRLREALGDPADRALYIERAPRQGYRFIAPLESLPAPSAGPRHEERAGAMLLHYRLIEKAGSGSMGEVWKAEDTRLGRTVALKFVPRRLAEDAGALEAFRREAQHTASLNHPNICTIHGLEECEGERFLVMEYIGGTLKTALVLGPLPAARILEIGTQVAEALAAAHAGGVIHRDVKPSNVMLTQDGQVKLTDFGIAANAPPGKAPLASSAHTPAGTLGYMSPEQARGEPVDARSDLFSLGVVLYELATGSRPFRGDTPEAVFQAVGQQVPEPPRALNPALPRELERVILKSLDKIPAARWQSASEMVEALGRIDRRRRRLAPAAVALAGAAIVGLALWQLRRPSPALGERDAIVVAEFENKTGDAVFDGALRQALLSQMAQSPYVDIVSQDRIVSALGTMSRQSGERLTRDVARDICQRCGAKAFLAGSIWGVGNRYFVGLDAVGCVNGEALASEYAEAETKGRVLGALGQAVSRMRARLGESLASVHRLNVLPEVTTSSLEALKLYSIAVEERATGKDVLPLIERAILIDPKFAAAHFTLARICQARGRDAEAESAITRAYALRERATERERLAIEGLYQSLVSGDAERGIATGRLGFELYPRDPYAWRWLVPAYMRTGEYDEALEVGRREVEALPKDGASYFDVALLLIALGRTREASAVLDRADTLGAGTEAIPFARFLIAATDADFAAMDRYAEAGAGKPWEPLMVLAQAQTAGYFGQLAKAREIQRDAARRGLRTAAAILSNIALMEVAFGLEREGSARARVAIQLEHGRRSASSCALALALAGKAAEAEAILDGVLRRYRDDTMFHRVWAPAARGAMALKWGDSYGALEAAKSPPNSAPNAWPAYIRGTAYLRLGRAAEAAVEFRRVIDWRSALFATAVGSGSAFGYPAAQVGLARALRMEGKREQSRIVYEEFLREWSRADPDLPILIEAKVELAELAKTLPSGHAGRGVERQ